MRHHVPTFALTMQMEQRQTKARNSTRGERNDGQPCDEVTPMHGERKNGRVHRAALGGLSSLSMAEIASFAARANNGGDGNKGDNFNTGEVGGEIIPVPDDANPNDPNLVMAERDAWEVRKLMRILRNIYIAMECMSEGGC
jgi:hypothetical protein